MIVADISSDQAAKILLVPRDDLIEDLAATTSDPPLRSTLLQRCLDAGPFGLQLCGLQGGHEFGIEDRIAVQEGVAIGSRLRKGFSPLLHNPLERRMSDYVVVQNSVRSMLDHEQVVQQLEGHHRHGEKVQGHDDLAVIANRCKPPFARIATAPNTPQLPHYAPFGNHQGEVLEFAVDLGSTPIWVLFCEPRDQAADFLGDPRQATARPGPATPIETETGAVSGHNALRRADDGHLGPAGLKLSQHYPEEPVQTAQVGTRPLPLENGDLLAQLEELEGSVAAATDEDADCGEERDEE